MLSDLEGKVIASWLEDAENIKSLSNEDRMNLLEAQKQLQEAQIQMERAGETVKNIVMRAMAFQRGTTFLFKM